MWRRLMTIAAILMTTANGDAMRNTCDAGTAFRSNGP
jgi:hypothetical protein